jgi:hypothetical protein
MPDNNSGNAKLLGCPSCGRNDQIDIAALVWVRQTPDGTDIDEADDHSHEWGDDNAVICRSCGKSGAAKDFQSRQQPD